MAQKFRVQEIKVKSGLSNRSGIITENMTSSTPDKLVGSTFKTVLVNEFGEQVVGPENSGGTSTLDVNQNGHGFALLDWLRFDESTSTWVKAQADDPEHLGHWHVVEVTDVNNFVVSKEGVYSIPNSLALGEYILSSSTAGGYTQTTPTVLGELVLYGMEVIDNNTVSIYTVSAFANTNSTSTPTMGGAGTTVVNQIYGNGADVTGTYTSDGGSPITDTGFVVYPSGNPTYTIGSPGVIDQSSGGTTSPISMNLNGLSSSTAYCTRPYATNSVGTSYGEEVCFTTLVAIQLFRVGGNQEDYADNFFMYGGVKYLLGKFNSPPNSFTSLDTFGVKKSFNNDFTSFTDTFFNDSNLNSFYTIHTIFQHSNGKFYGFGTSATTTAFSDIKVFIIRFDSSFVEEARAVWSVNQAAYSGDIYEIIEDSLTGNLILSSTGRSGAGFSGKVVVVNPSTLAIVTDCQAIGTGGGAAVTGVRCALFSQFRTSTIVESIGVKNTVEAAQNTPLVRFTTDLSTGNITAQQQLDYGQRIVERGKKIPVPGSTDFFVIFVRHTSGYTFNSGIIVTRFDTNYNPISTWKYDINGTNQGDVYGGYCNGTDLFILGLQGTTAVVIQVNATTGAVIDKIGLTGTSGSSSFGGILFEGSEVFLRGQTTQGSPGGTDMLLARLTLPFLTTGTSTPAGFNVSNPTITHTVLSNPSWIASSLPIASRTRTVAASAPQGPNVAYQGTITTSNWTII